MWWSGPQCKVDIVTLFQAASFFQSPSPSGMGTKVEQMPRDVQP
jgi:hypothetical protein